MQVHEDVEPPRNAAMPSAVGLPTVSKSLFFHITPGGGGVTHAASSEPVMQVVPSWKALCPDNENRASSGGALHQTGM
jgi:hypothetical protein